MGSGALHVRLLEPGQREQAEQVLARGSTPCTSSPIPRRCPHPAPTPTGPPRRWPSSTRAGVRIAGFSLSQPSLDEVFLALTGHPAEEQPPDEDLVEEKAAA